MKSLPFLVAPGAVRAGYLGFLGDQEGMCYLTDSHSTLLERIVQI